MLLSKNLLLTLAPGLKQYDQAELLKAFDAIGVEVESIMPMKHIDKLAFGLVKHVEQHPTRPHLHVCVVEVNGEDLQIECGAPNVAEGYTVIVAQIGTELPNKTIGAKDVGGIISYGMLCSYAEINPTWSQYLSKEENGGIILLPKEIYNSKFSVDQVLGLDDTVFDLFIPTNRNDLNGVIFLVNELKAALDSHFVFEDVSLAGQQSLPIQILSDDVKSFNWCSFELKYPYHETSWFWKRFMINSGIHVTNTVVDLANFISHLTANPIHFYDADKVAMEDVKVVNLDHEIEFTGLDGKQYVLQSGDLVVMAGGEIISLPGIMGGAHTMIHEKTTKIIVEIGTFNSQRIQATAKRLKISTPSADRFSKELSENLAGITWLVAQNQILKEYGKDFQVLFAMNKWEQSFVNADVDTLNRILGTKLSELDVQEILGRTGFKYVKGRISVPSYRTDIHDAQDIAEEIMKSININDFKPQQVIAPALLSHEKSTFQKIQDLRQLLFGKQISEVKTYNLTSKENAQKFNWFGIKDFVQIQNPLSSQREFFRGSMIPQMLDVLAENMNRKMNLQNIFEIQKIHYGYESFDCLTVLFTTDLFTNPLDGSVVKNNFLLAKNVWELIAQQFHVTFQVKASELPETYPEHTVALIVNDRTIGYIAQIRDQVTKNVGVKNLQAMVINLSELFAIQSKKPTINKVSELHPIFRDLSFIVPENFQIQPLIDDLKQIWTDVTLIDRFVKDGVTTYTIQLKLVPTDKTPTTEEINAIYQEARQKLNEHHLTLK